MTLIEKLTIINCCEITLDITAVFAPSGGSSIVQDSCVDKNSQVVHTFIVVGVVCVFSLACDTIMVRRVEWRTNSTQVAGIKTPLEMERTPVGLT